MPTDHQFEWVLPPQSSGSRQFIRETRGIDVGRTADPVLSEEWRVSL